MTYPGMSKMLLLQENPADLAILHQLLEYLHNWTAFTWRAKYTQSTVSHRQVHHQQPRSRCIPEVKQVGVSGLNAGSTQLAVTEARNTMWSMNWCPFFPDHWTEEHSWNKQANSVDFREAISTVKFSEEYIHYFLLLSLGLRLDDSVA